AHLLATLLSKLVMKSKIAQGYMKQVNEILISIARERIKKDEEVEEEGKLNVQISQNFDAIPI
ncbi:22485_t:CDS:1, partial [Gigaspora margarita]